MCNWRDTDCLGLYYHSLLCRTLICVRSHSERLVRWRDAHSQRHTNPGCITLAHSRVQRARPSGRIHGPAAAEWYSLQCQDQRDIPETWISDTRDHTPKYAVGHCHDNDGYAEPVTGTIRPLEHDTAAE